MIERRLKHGTSKRSRLRVQATFRDSRLDKISLTMSTGSNVRTDVSVTTVNLLVYRDQFVAEVVGHVADLNSGVNAPHAGHRDRSQRSQPRPALYRRVAM